MSSKILLKVYMSEKEKEAVKKYLEGKEVSVSSFVRELVLKEINYTSTLECHPECPDPTK